VTPTLLALLAVASAPSRPAAPEPGDHLIVYLVTLGPGPHVWERFGHNAILIRDRVTGTSRAYDYGRFSFAQAGFFIEFARGRMFYWMGVEDGQALLDAYRRRGRSIWLQELALPAAARSRLRELLEADWARDQGRYRYDYYKDNCSTRVRDAIDAVIGGVIRATLDTMASGTTWRWHTRRSLEHNGFQYFAVDASLGPGADRFISRYEETFLPLKLRDHLRDVRVVGEDGRVVPLVRDEFTLAASDRYAVPDAPADRTGLHLVAGLVVGVVLVALGGASRTAGRGQWARRGLVTLAGLWALVAGIGGGILVFFWAFSEHSIAAPNANVLQFNLLSLVLLALLAGVASGKDRLVHRARQVAVAIAVLSAVGLLLEAWPGFGQSTGPVVAFTLPVHLGVAVGLTRLGAGPAPLPIRPVPR
jgi:hypothetical protein